MSAINQYNKTAPQIDLGADSTNTDIFPVRLFINQDVVREDFQPKTLDALVNSLFLDIIKHQFQIKQNYVEAGCLFIALAAVDGLLKGGVHRNNLEFYALLICVSFMIIATKLLIKDQHIARHLDYLDKNYERLNKNRNEIYELMIVNEKEIKNLEHSLEGWKDKKNWLRLLKKIDYFNQYFFSPRGMIILPDVKKIRLDGQLQVQPVTRLRLFRMYKKSDGVPFGMEVSFDNDITTKGIALNATRVTKNHGRQQLKMNTKEFVEIEDELNKYIKGFLEALQASFVKKAQKEELDSVSNVDSFTSVATKEVRYSGIFTENGLRNPISPSSPQPMQRSLPDRREREKPEKVKTRPPYLLDHSASKSEKNHDVEEKKLANIQFLGNSKGYLKSGFREQFDNKLLEARGSFVQNDELGNTGKSVKGNVREIKTRSEERVYFTTDIKDENGKDQITVLGYSGTKPDQSEQINKAKQLFKELQAESKMKQKNK